jgi:hypothetical protein
MSSTCLLTGALWLSVLVLGSCKNSTNAADASPPSPSDASDTRALPPGDGSTPLPAPTVIARASSGDAFTQLVPSSSGLFGILLSSRRDGARTEDIVHVAATGETTLVVGDLMPYSHIVGGSSKTVVYASFCGQGLERHCLLRAELGGSGPKRIGLAKTGIASSAAMDDAAVYYRNEEPRSLDLVRLPLGGGAPKVIASRPYVDGGYHAGAAVAVDTLGVYWVADGVLIRVAKTGGEAVVLATDRRFNALASDGKHVYWTVGRDGLAVRRVAVSGGAVETLVEDAMLFPISVAVDDRFVYWVGALEHEAGWLSRVPKAGGPNEGLEVGRVAAFASDATSLYWVDPKTHSVVKWPIGQR